MFKKIFLSILVLSIFASLSFAETKWVRYSYFKNRGGLNNAFSPIVLEDDEASDLQNIVLNTDGTFKTKNGYTAINSTKTDTCVGLKYIKFSNGNQYLVGVFADDTIRKMDYGASGPDGTWDDITGDPISVGQNNLSNFVMGQDALLIEDGISTTKPQVWHGDAAVPASTLRGSPPNATLVAFHKNIAFAAGNSSAPSTLYFTDVGDIYNWTTGLSGNFNIDTNDGSIIRAIVPGFDALYIFKDYSIWRVTGDDKDNFQLQRMIQDIGCISPKSIVLLGNSFFFVSTQGDIYIYDGAVGLNNISIKIEGTIKEDMPFSRIPYINSLIYDKDYYCAISSSGYTQNNQVLFYDTFNLAWTKFSAMNINAMDIVDDGTGKDMIIFGDYHGDVFKFPSGNLNNTNRIASYYNTKQYRFPEAGYAKDFRLLKVYGEPVDHDSVVKIEVFSDAADGYYTDNFTIPGKNDSYVKFLAHFNGINQSTNIIDSSPSEHTITLNGNTYLDISQYRLGESSVLLDGDNDYLTVSDHADFEFSGDFTIEGYIRLNSNSASAAVIFAKGNSDYSLYINPNNSNGALTFQMNGNDISGVEKGSAWLINTWYHLAVVRSSSTVTVYVNGIAVGSVTNSNILGQNDSTFRIGTYSAGAPTEFFDGRQDEFRVSNGTARWTADFAPPIKEYGSSEDIAIGRFEVNKEGNYFKIKFSGNDPFAIKGWEIYVEPIDRI